MGRPVLFIPGIAELDEIETIAGISILGRVAKITAQYETPLSVPVRYPLVLAAGQEVVEQAYIEAGKKDATAKLEDGSEVTVEKVLVAIGRTPNIEGIGLEDVGVKIEDGIIAVDNQCKTSVEGIYAIGDAAEKIQYAHR